MSCAAPKQFNTAWPCDPMEHYMLPALPRLPNIRRLIDRKKYFVLHAPRQSGKTTSIMSLTQELNSESRYFALYCGVDVAKWTDDPEKAIPEILPQLKIQMPASPVEAIKKAWVDLPGLSASTALKGTLQVICSRLDKDLVIFLDEFDALSEKVLGAVLTQLKDGYINRGLAKFPRSINLIGMLNIRDYKAKVRPVSDRLISSSPYNIVTKALTLANFTKDEIKNLYGRHTEATGQVFEGGHR